MKAILDYYSNKYGKPQACIKILPETDFEKEYIKQHEWENLMHDGIPIVSTKVSSRREGGSMMEKIKNAIKTVTETREDLIASEIKMDEIQVLLDLAQKVVDGEYIKKEK